MEEEVNRLHVGANPHCFSYEVYSLEAPSHHSFLWFRKGSSCPSFAEILDVRARIRAGANDKRERKVKSLK